VAARLPHGRGAPETTLTRPAARLAMAPPLDVGASD